MKKLFITIIILLSISAQARSLRLPQLDHLRSQARLQVPLLFESKQKWPLVISLHGYRGNSFLQDLFLPLGLQVSAKGFMLLTPNGRTDGDGKQFWNASKYCCDFENTQVDDVGYIRKLIKQVQKQTGRLDQRRIYIVGHSNGAFMANKLAYALNGAIAGIATIAGTMDTINNELNYELAHAVPILHIHGTRDSIIKFNGGSNERAGYLSAEAFIQKWATNNHCAPTPILKSKRSFLSYLPGRESKIYAWNDCRARTGLIKMQHGGHTPIFNQLMMNQILSFFNI